MQNTKITVWKYRVKSTVNGTWNMRNKISVCGCLNRLTYVMVLIQIHTLLHFEQFILWKTTYIFCLIVLQTLISVSKSTLLEFKICWRIVTRNFIMDNLDLVLLNKLTTLYSRCFIEYVDFIFLYFSKMFCSFECKILSFCVCHHCYQQCVLQYAPLLETFLIFH